MTSAILRKVGSVCSLAVLLPLASCAVGPDYMTPSIELPERWSDGKAKQVPQLPTLAQWWRQLNDPLLAALVEEAVHNNLDVATAKARIREARALRRQAVGASLPSVAGFGDATTNRISESSSAPSVAADAPAYNLFRAGFDASWELDLFGANRRAIEAASYNVDAAEDDLQATLLTLIGDVASYYIDARGYQARAALARRTAASQRATAALTQTKFDVGSASAVDAAKAAGQAASTEAAIPTSEAAYAEAIHRLGILLGREPTALASRLSRMAPIPSPRLPLPKGIPADVLTARPDVRKAERQFAQYTAKVGQAGAALYPDLSLSGSISTSALKLGDLGRNSTIAWSLGPTLSMPIFNGGKVAAALEIAQAQRDQYYIAWRKAVLSALEDIENAIVLLARERSKSVRLTEAARRYGEAAYLARSLYQSGSSSFLDVLDAERSEFSVEDSLLQSRVAVAKEYVALAKALGGGWERPIDSTKPEILDANSGPHVLQGF